MGWIPALAVAVTALTHVRFLILDPRLPRDLCLCYQQVPGLARVLDGDAPGGVADVMGVLDDPAGWNTLLQATLIHLLGRGPHVIQGLDLVWVCSVVGLSALLARRLGGRAAGAVTALLVASIPGLVVEGRLGWIHVPEAALALAGLLAWLSDPTLSRWRTATVLSVVGAAAFSLRPSGLVWVGSLAVPLAWTAWKEWPRPARALAVIAACWGIAALVPLARLGEYLSSKAEARSRYAEVVPAMVQQLGVVLGPVGVWVVALALPAGLWQLFRRRPAGAPGLALSLLTLWATGAIALGALFLAGLDNHTTALPAVAILAGWALGGFAPRLGVGLAGISLAVHLFTQWMPTPGPTSSWWRTPTLQRLPVAPSVLNYAVPFPPYGESQVRALIDSVCGESVSPRGCSIAADQGLYVPYGEEPGRLELYLAGEERVNLLAVRDLDSTDLPRLDALVEFTCGDRDTAWRKRWPHSTQARDALVEAQRMEPAWSEEVAPGCVVWWLTPGGTVLDAARLPSEGRPGRRISGG